MVDREARDLVALKLRAFMNGEIGSFEFDDDIFDCIHVTPDETLSTLCEFIWKIFYSDLEDHLIRVDKVGWDALNRVLLILDSDGELEEVRSKPCWNWTQIIAVVVVTVFAYLVIRVGGDPRVWLLLPLLALVSTLISKIKDHQRKADYHLMSKIWPLPDVTSLSRLRRHVREFKKTPYPGSLNKEQPGSRSLAVYNSICGIVLWSIINLAMLLRYAFPEREKHFELTLSSP